MTNMRQITVYKTPTCGTCSAVLNRLRAEGITPEIIDLTEHPDRLAELKSHFNVDIIQVPLIQWGTRYENIAGFTQLLSDYKEHAAAA